MKLVRGDRMMEVYYWEEDGDDEDVALGLAGTIVTLGTREVVLIPQGLDAAAREVILTKVWPKR